MSNLDWALVQAFLAVGETGSLSGGARALNMSQPTLSRQVKALEAALGAELFHRRPKGLELSETGAGLMEPARAMREAMNEIALRAAGQQEALQGTVRITASVAVSFYHLPKIVAEMRRLEPDIQIEIVPSDQTSNLLYREADIAIRMYRPEQLDLITQHLGDMTLSAFAANSYLTLNGDPTPDNIMSHQFVGYDGDTSIIEGMREAGLPVDREFFPVRCDNNLVYWQMVREGCGIGYAQASVGRADPRVTEIDFGFPLPVLPVWLTAHEAMRKTPRIRRVWDMLAHQMKLLIT